MEKTYNLCESLLFPVLFITLITSSIGFGSAAGPVTGTTSTEFIKTSCSATVYPRLCYSSLASHASAIQRSPKRLADTALSLSLNTTRSTAIDIVKLSKSSGLTPRELGAMRDCVEEIRDAVDRLRSSVAEMKQIDGSNFSFMISDIQTWVSAALTYEDTCTDGFAGKTINGGVKPAVRARILNAAHMTSNALALINSYAALHG